MSQHAHDHAGHGGGQHAAGDPPSGHGMAIVGRETVFLSHLPMFMRPHDYQVILEVTFSGDGTDPQRTYADDRAAHPDAKPYTFDPERFVLTDLVPPGPGQPARRRSFRGDIYRGHFERFPSQAAKDAARIGRGVVANVARVVLFEKFDPRAAELGRLEYLLFGKGPELFLAHAITKPPDFDQLLAVTVAGQAVPEEALGRGVAVAFPGRANTSDERIEVGRAASGVMRLAGREVPVEVMPTAELYFETGDLASAM
jgi:hypothetical protein